MRGEGGEERRSESSELPVWVIIPPADTRSDSDRVFKSKRRRDIRTHTLKCQRNLNAVPLLLMTTICFYSKSSL